ncbi:hypothetical protein SAMN04515655_11156 [Halanaerobium congolense]|jgi:hypothetical protein|uniref:Uncharacterized protein n=2 Tax=Halanaerobium TaxID=2330 RepID=A0A1G6NV84_9FIRM|nr:hypothetical protein [Halanaerobium congolense]PUU91587.1 MAG: hypothetical protein CI948_1071 [Halanaerobium sp.]PXV60070.1 hypothetical protein C8C78_1613 [Halanaerobium congolense]TDP19171.1 hypothetical protein C8C79_11153 [Halanaerobium congolense]TDS29572.1 hypothetical protein BY453_11760 [Halanaerobium congolense]SDC71699.1 hypothetical protein SAMN04488597_11261 [Halanaerobium congolense]
MELNEKQLKLCEENTEDFSNLKALFINCTLKKSPQTSNTRGLMDVAKAIMEKNLENDFTQRNTTFMTWNLMHLAKMLKGNDGITAHGNQRSAWDAGCSFDHPNPEYR